MNLSFLLRLIICFPFIIGGVVSFTFSIKPIRKLTLENYPNKKERLFDVIKSTMYIFISIILSIIIPMWLLLFYQESIMLFLLIICICVSALPFSVVGLYINTYITKRTFGKTIMVMREDNSSQARDDIK
jgi:hypothetical protein